MVSVYNFAGNIHLANEIPVSNIVDYFNGLHTLVTLSRFWVKFQGYPANLLTIKCGVKVHYLKQFGGPSL
jgi:hypothetical protein